jgi:hypothetical protein
MISQLIQRLTQDEPAWDCCIEILAALPGNH